MNKLNDEIKLTLDLMQTINDDSAHGELQGHLYKLLEMKRNELQKCLSGQCPKNYQDPDRSIEAPELQYVQES